jgi:maltose O-acetyltransferase
MDPKHGTKSLGSRPRRSDPWRAAAFDVYLVGVNHLLTLPGHAFRLFVFRRVCRWTVGPGTCVERGVRVTTKGGVTVGRGCLIHRGALLDGRGGLIIGDLVNIAPGVTCLTADHDPDSPDFAGRSRAVVIGSRSWITTNAMILPGSTIHEGAVVGAGSVVSGEVPGWTVVAGAPARRIRDRNPEAQTTLPYYRRWLH